MSRTHAPPALPPDVPPDAEVAARGLAKAFDGRQVLNPLDLTIRQGEIVAIVGASGSGKTVLMQCLCGLLAASAGTVWARDHSRPGAPRVAITHMGERELEPVRRAWSVVFQQNALFSGSVYENCAIWLRENLRWDEARIDVRVRKVLADTGLDVKDVLPKGRDALSGGMAKRVAVARALVSDPAVIWYDEPTTGLDPGSARVIHDLIWQTHHARTASGVQRTSVIVTHDRDLLRRLHPRVVMLDGGTVCFDGPYEAFAHAAGGPAAAYLAEMPALQGRPVAPPQPG